MPPGQNEGQIKKRLTSALDLNSYTGDRTSQEAVLEFWIGTEIMFEAGIQQFTVHWVEHKNGIAADGLDWREHISDKAESKFDVQIYGDGRVEETDTGTPVIVVSPT